MNVNEILTLIAPLLPPGTKAWLVGGTVRDLLSGRPTRDIDIATTGDPEALSREAARMLGGTSFPLDAERGVFRAVLPSGLQLDVSRVETDIESDLRRRDFTVNAMAIPLITLTPFPSPALSRPFGPPSPGKRKDVTEGRGGRTEDIIDPTGGRADLSAGIIRAVSEDNLVSDPLRLLRAFRLSAALGFSVEEKTLGYIKEHAGQITQVSPERVRDELYLLLQGAGTADVFRKMWGPGLLSHVIPEMVAMDGLPQSEPHSYDLLNHSLKAMEYAEEVIGKPEEYFGGRAGEVREYLGEPVDGSLSMAGLVKLFALLHDIGKPSKMTIEEGRIRFTGHDEAGAVINIGIAGRLRMSNRAAETLERTTRLHMRPLHMTKGRFSAHALYRYVRDVQPDLPASLIVALADAFATREKPDAAATDVEGIVETAAEYYYGEFLKEKEEPLVSGKDLIEVFGLKPGPMFGKILEEIEEMRGGGVLKDREDALSYIRQNINKFTTAA